MKLDEYIIELGARIQALEHSQFDLGELVGSLQEQVKAIQPATDTVPPCQVILEAMILKDEDAMSEYHQPYYESS